MYYSFLILHLSAISVKSFSVIQFPGYCIGPRYLSWSKTAYEKNKLLIDRSSIISYPESLYNNRHL